jgi:hypothetical protein
MKLKQFIKNLYFLRILFSPFVNLKIKFYFGELGYPYFTPNKFSIKENKVIRFAFYYNPLGWKTKFSMIRFEYNPTFSFILFNKQLNLIFQPNISLEDAYWEAWLHYYKRTDKKLSTKERLYQLFEQHSCLYIYYINGEKKEVDNYLNILTKRYVKVYQEWKKEKDISYQRDKKIKELGL